MYVEQMENGLDLKDIAQNIAAVYDTSLSPGENIPFHLHPDFEELYYILSGYGIMTIGEERKEISRNDVVYIPQQAVHSLLNTAEVPLRFVTLSVKVAAKKTENIHPYFG